MELVCFLNTQTYQQACFSRETFEFVQNTHDRFIFCNSKKVKDRLSLQICIKLNVYIRAFKMAVSVGKASKCDKTKVIDHVLLKTCQS